MLTTWPNVNPPIIITGVGPHGHKIVYTQPPEGMSSTDITATNDDCPGSSGVFDVASQTAPGTQHQYQTLLEAMVAAQAYTSNEEASAAKGPPVPSEPVANKENVVLPSTPCDTSLSSSYAKAMIDKAKSNIKKLDRKSVV